MWKSVYEPAADMRQYFWTFGYFMCFRALVWEFCIRFSATGHTRSIQSICRTIQSTNLTWIRYYDDDSGEEVWGWINVETDDKFLHFADCPRCGIFIQTGGSLACPRGPRFAVRCPTRTPLPLLHTLVRQQPFASASRQPTMTYRL